MSLGERGMTPWPPLEPPLQTVGLIVLPLDAMLMLHVKTVETTPADKTV